MREPIASPCKQICNLGHDQVCVGCGRTITEIAEWPAADEARRAQIVQNAARRHLGNSMVNKDKESTPKVTSMPKAADFAHRIELAVRWGDMDVMGHINNAKFFTYDESSRIAYFDELARADKTFWNDHGLILAHIGCDFIAQLRYPATLVVGTRVSKLGRSSLHTLSAMFEGERLVAVVKGVIVWFDYVNQKTMPIPEHVREMIRKRERLAPEES